MKRRELIWVWKHNGNGMTWRPSRTTPCLLGLYSLVTLLAAGLSTRQQLTVRSAAWYTKEVATFSDTIALVRRHLWSQQSFQLSHTEANMIKGPRALIERFTDALCYAA